MVKIVDLLHQIPQLNSRFLPRVLSTTICAQVILCRRFRVYHPRGVACHWFATTGLQRSPPGKDACRTDRQEADSEAEQRETIIELLLAPLLRTNGEEVSHVSGCRGFDASRDDAVCFQGHWQSTHINEASNVASRVVDGIAAHIDLANDSRCERDRGCVKYSAVGKVLLTGETLAANTGNPAVEVTAPCCARNKGARANLSSNRAIATCMPIIPATDLFVDDTGNREACELAASSAIQALVPFSHNPGRCWRTLVAPTRSMH